MINSLRRESLVLSLDESWIDDNSQVFHDLEEALLTDGHEESESPLLLKDLIVRLLGGILASRVSEINAYNYETYLRRVVKVKWEVSVMILSFLE
ncbi:unnamed protein product [Notodromas monacha]|uniref:Uncharacterized protein n=1 Tax=Notodromas monacha TaxID=399045 RepID=A0A7R9BT88_9CRUS|nr:unnamed protein product [Notodromas monacha]CAG0921324.1 unnamed protein product [Notodromas monacha]